MYRKSVNNENGNKIGDLEILEGEEVIDGVVMFLRTLNANFDATAFRGSSSRMRVQTDRLSAELATNEIIYPLVGEMNARPIYATFMQNESKPPNEYIQLV